MSPMGLAQRIEPARLRRYALSLCLAVGIIVAWGVSAAVLDQPFFTAQKSRLLLEIGAVNGQLLMTHEWWRLLTSQFLHVHFLHMLFNALCILILSGLLEQKYGWWRSSIIYFVGGTIGQWGSVIAYPTLVSSGASQALMALCGAAVLMLRRNPRIFASTIVVIQVALDLYVAQYIKVGHSSGFIAGLALGGLLLLASDRAARSAIAIDRG